MSKININRIPFVIPFMPNKIEYTGCQNIKLCGRLFVPCCNETITKYCVKCKGKEDKYGTLSRRLYMFNNKKQFVSPSNVREIDYIGWLKKNNRTVQQVNNDLCDLDITLNISLRMSKRSPSVSSDEEAN